MTDEQGFVQAIQARPADDAQRLVYADWLEERGDLRAEYLRLDMALRRMDPDHVARAGGELRWNALRKEIAPDWLASLAPAAPRPPRLPNHYPWCDCVDHGDESRKLPAPNFHMEPQDTECAAWKMLVESVEEAAADGREEFNPLYEWEPADRAQIITLPPSIGKLKRVVRLELYGSHLVRIPPEIGEMTSLQSFDPYTSYRLHWFPYEITRCKNLRGSRVSTRALYGNFKYRPPFPKLTLESGASLAKSGPTDLQRPCSVCRQPFADRREHRVWLSLRVATDVLPLLVNACSKECLAKLPAGADDHVRLPHRGGTGIQQPPTYWEQFVARQRESDENGQ